MEQNEYDGSGMCPIPVNFSPQEQVMQMAAINNQKRMMSMWEQSNLEVWRYDQKRKIDEESILRIERARADIHIKKNLLVEKFEITQDGEIISTQEFLTERPRSYSFTNFRLASCPVVYTCRECYERVLYLPVILQNMQQFSFYLDLGKEKASYYWKKFRNAGLHIKKRRKEKPDMIFDIIGLLSKPGFAERVELPLKRGFYLAEDGRLCYAEKDDLLWRTVKEYAR